MKTNVEDRAGARLASAYVILKSGTTVDGAVIPAIAGKIIVSRSRGGTVYVGLWDWSDQTKSAREVQQARAGGYGYDKVASCIEGMKFSSLTLSLSWQSDLDRAGFLAFQVL